MYQYYNCNPNGNRVGDCVVRAISKALNMSWYDVSIEIFIQGLLMGDMMTGNAVWGTYLRNKGFTRDIVSNDCPECYTIEDFCNEHPQGTFVIGTGTHAVCIENGCVFDTWNSSGETPIYFYYKGE